MYFDRLYIFVSASLAWSDGLACCWLVSFTGVVKILWNLAIVADFQVDFGLHCFLVSFWGGFSEISSHGIAFLCMICSFFLLTVLVSFFFSTLN